MERTVKLTEEVLTNIVKEILNEIVGNKQRQPFRMWNGYVVLRHDSNSRITNGVIDGRGKQKNNYSKNSDASNYFWASEKPGKDPSNTASIHYYCLVEPDRIYDFETNPKGYNSLKDAMANEEYVSGRWGDGAIAVMTSNPTEISFIEDDGGIDGPGAVYDSQWHMLRSLGKFYNNKRNQQLAMKMKPYQDVEVPEFLGGYSYEDLINP